jgi:hypothetical protein
MRNNSPGAALEINGPVLEVFPQDCKKISVTLPLRELRGFGTMYGCCGSNKRVVRIGLTPVSPSRRFLSSVALKQIVDPRPTYSWYI